MEVINKSRKIIGIKGEPLLPGYRMELPEGYETHPSIIGYLEKGMLADGKLAATVAAGGISDLERRRIAEEAVAQYKKQQEKAAGQEAAEKMEKEAEIKAVKAMKKPELLAKAAGMGLGVADDDTADILKEKILEAIGQ